MSYANWTVILETKMKSEAFRIINLLESKKIHCALKFYDPWYFLGYFFGKSRYQVWIPSNSSNIAQQIIKGKEPVPEEYAASECF